MIKILFIIIFSLYFISDTFIVQKLSFISAIKWKIADKHEELVLINGDVLCSGAMIAPKVVLTAGHCIIGSSYYNVIAPFSGYQQAKSVKLLTFDYSIHSILVDEIHHDVGLIILDRPIFLLRYPEIAKVENNSDISAVSFGRMKTNNSVYISASHKIHIKSKRYYDAYLLLQPGDSGGPVEIAGAQIPYIIAVNSGRNSNRVLYARIDSLFEWISQTIAIYSESITHD